MTLDSQMAQKSSPKIFSKKSYHTCGAFKSKKPLKSSKKSVFNGKLRPLYRRRRLDIESLNSHDIRLSDGSKKFTKNLFKKYLIVLAALLRVKNLQNQLKSHFSMVN